MNTEYKIAIYLKSYTVDKSAWDKLELRNINWAYTYKAKCFVSLFLTVINDNYVIVYKTQPSEYEILKTMRNYQKGLYILEINTVDNSIISFEPLNELILGNLEELKFGNIRITKTKRDYFSVYPSVYERNIELFIQNDSSEKRFSSIEQNWVEYIYESSIYNAFAQNLIEIFHNYIKAYKDAHDEVKHFNLQEILDNLQVKVDELFITKVGGDDSYYIEETRTISYPIANLDKYLIEYIKIGQRTIHEDSGYIEAHKMAIPGLKTGILPAEDVELIRKKLISQYSIETHIFNKIDYILKQYKEYLEIPQHHRGASSLDAYLMSSRFISSLETIIGGEGVVVDTGCDNIESLIKKANHYVKKIMWWKD